MSGDPSARVGRVEATEWGVAISVDDRRDKFFVRQYRNRDAASRVAKQLDWVMVDWHNPMNDRRGTDEVTPLVARGENGWVFVATGWKVPM